MKDYAQEISYIEELFAELKASLQSLKDKAEAAGDRVAKKEADKIGREIAARVNKIPSLKSIDYTSHESLRPEHDALKAKWAEEAKPYKEYIDAFSSKLKTVIESLQKVKTPVVLRFKFADNRADRLMNNNGRIICKYIENDKRPVVNLEYGAPVILDFYGERITTHAIGDIIRQHGVSYMFDDFAGLSANYFFYSIETHSGERSFYDEDGRRSYRICDWNEYIYTENPDMHDRCTIPATVMSLRILKKAYEYSDAPDKNQAVAGLEALLELQNKRVPRPEFLKNKLFNHDIPFFNCDLPEMALVQAAQSKLSQIEWRDSTPYEKAERKIAVAFKKISKQILPVGDIIGHIQEADEALECRQDIASKKSEFLGGAKGSERNQEQDKKRA